MFSNQGIWESDWKFGELGKWKVYPIFFFSRAQSKILSCHEENVLFVHYLLAKSSFWALKMWLMWLTEFLIILIIVNLNYFKCNWNNHNSQRFNETILKCEFCPVIYIFKRCLQIDSKGPGLLEGKNLKVKYSQTQMKTCKLKKTETTIF